MTWICHRIDPLSGLCHLINDTMHSLPLRACRIRRALPTAFERSVRILSPLLTVNLLISFRIRLAIDLYLRSRHTISPDRQIDFSTLNGTVALKWKSPNWSASRCAAKCSCWLLCTCCGGARQSALTDSKWRDVKVSAIADTSSEFHPCPDPHNVGKKVGYESSIGPSKIHSRNWPNTCIVRAASIS